MHSWDDDWFAEHGESLKEAERWIGRYVYTHSLCMLSSKEKYGTLRYEHIMPPPHRLWVKYSIEHHWHSSRLCGMWKQWGKRMLMRAVRKATIKWPHLRNEIVADSWSLGW